MKNFHFFPSIVRRPGSAVATVAVTKRWLSYNPPLSPAADSGPGHSFPLRP